jgi:DNA-binding HxlR family transcriptional regulator
MSLYFQSAGCENRFVAEFRYAQFCPLARATEIVGERWTLLIVRELWLGPKRFSDFEAPLSGISSSVLADRLARLETRGIVKRRELPPPTPVTVYELDEAGRALLPVAVELSRWGARFLGTPEAGDYVDPGWVQLAAMVFGRREATPPRRFQVTAQGEGREVTFHLRGGAGRHRAGR